MKPNKPMDKNHESTGRLSKLSESEELLKIINQLEDYQEHHNTVCKGNFKIEPKKNTPNKMIAGLYRRGCNFGRIGLIFPKPNFECFCLDCRRCSAKFLCEFFF